MEIKPTLDQAFAEYNKKYPDAKSLFFLWIPDGEQQLEVGEIESIELLRNKFEVESMPKEGGSALPYLKRIKL